MTKTLLWLDDCRDPLKNDWLNFSPIGKDVETHWVKTYLEFAQWIAENGLPDAICFDHDLSDFQAFKFGYPELMDDIPMPEHEKTGMDCAKFLVEYCLDHRLKLPPYGLQSSNPTGRQNIDSLLKNFIKNVEMDF